MKKVLICGAFGFKNMDTGGQPVKTRELYYGLQEQLGEDQVIYIETSGWKKHPVRLLTQFFKKAHDAKNIIMLPAHKGVIIFSRLLKISKIINHNKIYYDVVGGWLPEKVEQDSKLKEILASFDGIWVETTIMNNRLTAAGLNNVAVVRNFKNLKPVTMTDLEPSQDGTLRLCMFSRVMREKGIEDAIQVVKELVEKHKTRISLDIFGAVDSGYQERFEAIKNVLPDYIRYKGVVSPSDSVETLKVYDALLFPTKYKTEGLPGTIIDAYAAGIPVISARWESFQDIVDDGNTGVGYIQNDNSALMDSLLWACNNPEKIRGMKRNCIVKAKEFMRPYVIMKLINQADFK